MAYYKRRKRRGRLPLRFLLVLAFFLLMALIIIVPTFAWGIMFLQQHFFQGNNNNNNNNNVHSSYQFGAITAPDGEQIGISDGTFAFDTARTDGKLKLQGSMKLKAGDKDGAMSDWKLAVEQETNDAETLIYIEDQRILNTGSPYITLIIGTILTGAHLSSGRDSLQGAYVAQKEYNQNCYLPRCTQVRLLIANSGSGDNPSNGAAYAGFIMQLIVQAANADSTIVGVMGWPLSSSLYYVNTALESAHIPIVSPSSPIGSSANKEPFVFRVAQSNTLQGIVGAEYAEQTLLAKKVVLFVDPLDPYSDDLATAFSQRFINDGNSIVATEIYSVGNSKTLLPKIQDALLHDPDLIYFAGYPEDVSILLTNLPTCKSTACLLVLGGDAFYDLGGYSFNARYNFDHLRFTAFAHPDIWDALGLTQKKPLFFSEYPSIFDPTGQNRGKGGIYGYSRTDNGVMLSYDAMLALLEASKIALKNGSTLLTSSELQQALTKITGDKAIQGVSGQISFGSDNNPIDKSVVIVCVDKNPFFHLDEVYGQFLIGGPVETRVHLNPVCT